VPAAEFDIRVISHVIEMGGIRARTDRLAAAEIADLARGRRALRRSGGDAADSWPRSTTRRRRERRSGRLRVVALNVPSAWDARPLDRAGREAGQALMSIQAIKGSRSGRRSRWPGRGDATSRTRSIIAVRQGGVGPEGSSADQLCRRAGGGIATGQPIVLRAAMKPISTQHQPLLSVTSSARSEPGGRRAHGHHGGAGGGVVGEAVVAFEIARALREKVGGDVSRDATKSRRLLGYLSSW